MTIVPLSLDEIRKRIIIGLFSDDELLDRLVLKGGNAIEVVYALASRASFDLDFSMEDRFDDLDKARERIGAALQREFRRSGLVVIDLLLEEKPSIRRAGAPNWWGGYLATFKLVDRETFEQYKDQLDALRRRAEVVGPQNKKTYKIDISAHEFCGGKRQWDLDDYTVYVYSLEMVLIEKLRAICQQMDGYSPRSHNRTQATCLRRHPSPYLTGLSDQSLFLTMWRSGS